MFVFGSHQNRKGHKTLSAQIDNISVRRIFKDSTGEPNLLLAILLLAIVPYVQKVPPTSKTFDNFCNTALASLPAAKKTCSFDIP